MPDPRQTRHVREEPLAKRRLRCDPRSMPRRARIEGAGLIHHVTGHSLSGSTRSRRRCATRLPLAAGEDDGRLPLARARVLPAAEPSPPARRDRRAESRPRYASAPRTPCCAHERPDRAGPGPCGATAVSRGRRGASAREPPWPRGEPPTRASGASFLASPGQVRLARGTGCARGVSRGRQPRAASSRRADQHDCPPNLASPHGVTAPTVPDPSRSRAMTMRWISLVPS